MRIRGDSPLREQSHESPPIRTDVVQKHPTRRRQKNGETPGGLYLTVEECTGIILDDMLTI